MLYWSVIKDLTKSVLNREIRKSWRQVARRHPWQDSYGFVYGYYHESGDESYGYAILWLRPAETCDHFRSLCLNPECFRLWNFIYPYIDFSVSKGGQEYRRKMMRHPHFPAKYRRVN